MVIPEQYQGSPALQFVQSRGWDFKPSTPPQIELEACPLPLCKKSGYGHFYMECRQPHDELARRDGLWNCHRCGQSGNLITLKQKLGLVIEGVQSRADWSASEKTIEPLPDIDKLHEALLEDADAMDYLINYRGFSQEIIEKQKLGLTKRYFRKCGETRALAYPYLVNGNCTFVHFRSLPTMPISENKVPKDFNSLKGWDAPLYNTEILKEGLREVIFVEGEANVIAALDKGYGNICGVPGANFKKADWIDTLDKMESLEKIYICYDNDKVGQKAAQTLASRIGIEKCWKILLPTFQVTTDEGETRKGKDLNEWFTNGGTLEQLEKLKEEATLFDVDGVNSSRDALDLLYENILDHGVEGKYKTPWESLSKLVTWDEGDVIDFMAPEKIGKTTVAMNVLEYMADQYGEDGLMICLEMTTVKLARKWVAHKAGIADNIPKNDEEANALKEQFLTAIPLVKASVANREGNIYWCYPKYSKPDDIYKLIIDCIRRYGVKWIVLDNLQRLCDTTIGSKNRTQHLSEMSKVTSQIAKDYGVQFIRILQPHRIKDGQMVTTDDVDGSSQVAKDCDCMVTFHRNKLNEISAKDFENMGYIESEAAFDEKMLATVGLSRYSTGGYVVLRFDGARSTVTEYNIGEIAALKADKEVGYQAQLKKLIADSETTKGEIVL